MAAPRPIPPSRAAGVPAAAVLVVGTAAMIVRELVHVFGSTRAAPPEEFVASAVLFAIYDATVFVLYGASALFAGLVLHALWIELRAWRAGARARADLAGVFALFLALAGQLAVVWHGAGMLLAGAGLFIAFLVSESRRLDESPSRDALQTASRVMAQSTLRGFGRAATEILAIPAAAFLLAVVLELGLFTWRFAGDAFSVRDFWQFAAVASSAAVITGARFAVELTLMLLVARELFASRRTGLRRALLPVLCVAGFSLVTSATWSGLEVVVVTAVVSLIGEWLAPESARNRRIVALPIVTGIYVWARMKDFLLSALGDEVTVLGLDWMVDTCFGLCALLIALWTHRGLVASITSRRPRGVFDLVSALALSVVSPLLPLYVRSRRTNGPGVHASARLVLPALIFLGVCIALLVEVNYPHFIDFSQRAQRLYSMLLGLFVFLLLLILHAWLDNRFLLRRSSRWIVGVVAAAAILGYGGLQSLQVPRMIGAQYSMIARRILAMAALVPHRPDRGPDDPAPPGAEHPVLARMERYPAARTPGFVYATRRPPIFLIVWDGARPDHMGVYGYHRATTPVVSRLAEEGILFERAYANGTATTTSMRHLFTGMHSSRYMLARDHGPFFTGALVAEGYDRIFVNILGTDYNGVSRDAFLRNHPDRAPVEAATTEFRHYDEAPKIEAAIAFIEGALRERADRLHPGDGLFLFLHCTAMHAPWVNHDDHPIYGTTPIDRYDNSIGHADKALGDFFAFLRARDLYDDAIIVLTSDHGTGLGEHGKLGGFQPYEEQIRVPLIIKAPGFAPRRVAVPAAGIDLAPTLLSLLRPGALNPYDGFSLVGLMDGSTGSLGRRYILSLNSFEDAIGAIDLETNTKIHLHGIERYEMFFDLTADPGEKHNLADIRVADRTALSDLVRVFLWRGRLTYGNPYNYRPVRLD